MSRENRAFNIDEKVLVYQGPILYDAKIVKTFDPVSQKMEYFDEKKKSLISVAPDKRFPKELLSEVCYMVHYNGWNSKWDEWVLVERILEYTNENLMLKESLVLELQEKEKAKQKKLEEEEHQKELKRLQMKIQKNGRNRLKADNHDSMKIRLLVNGSKLNNVLNGHGGDSRIGKPQKDKPKLIRNCNSRIKGEYSENGSHSFENGLLETLQNKRKKLNESLHYESKTGFTHHEMKVLVPDDLKRILVDDWEQITKNSKLVALDGENNVARTLDDFSKYIKSTFNDEEKELNVLLEITESLRNYFEQCVGVFLLYRYERHQYNKILEDEERVKNLDAIYSPIFLLRLLSIFPSILMMNGVDAATIKISKAYLDIILNWLDLHKTKYLKIEYENQSPYLSLIHS